MEMLFKKKPLLNSTETEIDAAIREYTLKNRDSIRSATSQSQQSGSSDWHKERSIRITSSNFGMILGYRGKKARMSHIKTLMGYYGNLQKKCLAHGQDFEPVARRCYINETRNQVTPCGLVISKDFHFLAASPDGLVTDITGKKGLLEIKCPFCLKEQPLEVAGTCTCTPYVDIAS
jgi:hypothetical protein